MNPWTTSRPLLRTTQVNTVFLFDLILQFFLHYQTGSEDGATWVGTRSAIAMHYLKGNFIIE